MTSKWISYNDLAWTENWLAEPKEYEIETNYFIDLIKEYSVGPDISLLHFGCGAGGHDTFLKKHFEITGVDLSKGMLEIARKRHPEIEYIEGDMRTIKLDRQFDVVAIPDSIGYMASEKDLAAAISNAAAHLKPGGILIIVAITADSFQNNNFVYTGDKDGISVTLFENNYNNPLKPDTYEATFIYLIRKDGKLSVHTENQILGLFSLSTWERLFGEAQIAIRKTIARADIYDKYIMDEGSYPLTILVGEKIKS